MLLTVAKQLNLKFLQTTGWKKCESSQNEKEFQNGTSYAFEFGSETPICPIAVEDLEHPGHMLIEVCPP